jgi:catechol 2,3-dioxygenase-like lactoylglutathione lyase family enzyme
MGLTHINFVSIPVADQDRALAFWRDVMGLTVQVDAPYAEGWRWIFLTLPDGKARLQFARMGEVQVTGVPALALACHSVDAEAERLRGLGVTIEGGPADAPWTQGVRWMTLRDSEGNLVLLESRAG